MNQITPTEARFYALVANTLKISADVYAIKNILIKANLCTIEDLDQISNRFLDSENVANIYGKSQFVPDAYTKLSESATEEDLKWIREEGIKYFSSEEIESIIASAQTVNSLSNLFNGKGEEENDIQS